MESSTERFKMDPILGELQAEGHLDSTGVFTSSGLGALERLSQKLLPDSSLYWLKVIQALVASGAREIRTYEKTGWVRIEASTPSRSPQLNPKDWVGQAWRNPDPALRYLPIALLGAWRQFSEIHVDWGEQRLLFRPPSLAPEPLESPEPAFGVVQILFKRKRWKLLVDRPPFSDRLFACPVPVRAVSYNSALTQAHAFGFPQASGRPWCEGALGGACRGEREGRLVAPDSICGMTPVFFEERTPHPNFESQEKPDTYAAHWYPVERIYLVLPGDDPGLLIPVEAGVALNPVPAELGIQGLRCVVSVEREGLHTDLSQFSVRHDEALKALIESVREQAPRMTAMLFRRLEHWKPPGVGWGGTYFEPMVGFFAGGAVGIGMTLMTGLPLHFLALPGAMLGTHFSARRWHRKALAELQKKLQNSSPE